MYALISYCFKPRCSSAQWVEWLWNWRVEYWAIRPSVCSVARTAYSFACSALLALLTRSAVLIRSLARSWERGFCLWHERVDFIQFQPTVPCSQTLRSKSHGHCLFALRRLRLLTLSSDFFFQSWLLHQSVLFHFNKIYQFFSLYFLRLTAK